MFSNWTYLDIAKWTGVAAGVVGATLIALNIGIVEYGYIFFLVSSLLWMAVGVTQRERSLVVLQLAFTIVNILGLYRWVGG
jgi:nicotinamide riboside transporter PnuC